MRYPFEKLQIIKQELKNLTDEFEKNEKSFNQILNSIDECNFIDVQNGTFHLTVIMNNGIAIREKIDHLSNILTEVMFELSN